MLDALFSLSFKYERLLYLTSKTVRCKILPLQTGAAADQVPTASDPPHTVVIHHHPT